MHLSARATQSNTLNPTNNSKVARTSTASSPPEGCKLQIKSHKSVQAETQTRGRQTELENNTTQPASLNHCQPQQGGRAPYDRNHKTNKQSFYILFASVYDKTPKTTSPRSPTSPTHSKRAPDGQGQHTSASFPVGAKQCKVVFELN